MGKLTIETAMVSLRKAQEHYEKVHKECEDARRRETDAKNDLNKAQKQFDDAVAEVKKNPPWDSDWHRANQCGNSREP